MDNFTITDLKMQNRSRVFNLIYHSGKTCKQDIATALGLSLPTVSHNLKELEEMGLIEKKGYFASSGGRKAQMISCVAGSRIAIGVETTGNHLRMCAVDLLGQVISVQRVSLKYCNTDAYYQAFGERILEFIDSLKIPADKILGVGITVQGLVSPDGQQIVYAKLMDDTSATLDDFSRYLPYPCYLMHDSEAAAAAELWLSPEIKDAVYISLSQRIGTAVIINGMIHHGSGIGSGRVEHMTVRPQGVPCYCGRQGCLDCYCSVAALCEDEKNLDLFFEKLRNGDEEAIEKWKDYTDILTSAIANIYMVIDCEVILGGSLSSYLTKEDAEALNGDTFSKCYFPNKKIYARLGKGPRTVISMGAALHYIREFLDAV